MFETVWTIHSIAPRQLNGQLIRRARKQARRLTSRTRLSERAVEGLAEASWGEGNIFARRWQGLHGEGRCNILTPASTSHPPTTPDPPLCSRYIMDTQAFGKSDFSISSILFIVWPSQPNLWRTEKNVWLAQSSLNSCLCNHLKVVFLGPIILAWHREIASVVPTLRAHFVQSQAKRGLATGKEGGGGAGKEWKWAGCKEGARCKWQSGTGYLSHRPPCRAHMQDSRKQQSLNSSILWASTAWAYQLN